MDLICSHEKNRLLLIVQLLVLLVVGQDYKSAQLPVKQHVNDLLQRMTTEQKL